MLTLDDGTKYKLSVYHIIFLGLPYKLLQIQGLDELKCIVP